MLLSRFKLPALLMAGSFAFFFGLFEAYDLLELTWLDTLSDGTISALFLITLSTITTLLGLLLLRIETAWSNAPISNEPNFEDTILRALTVELDSKRYSEVIRIGDALVRPLFEAGSFSTRLAIGQLVEEAAARAGRKEKQVSALVDAVGWSLVELGEYDRATKEINHGLELARETSNRNYVAKALRHLGVIARRRMNYADAERLYNESLDASSLIEDSGERDEFAAGLEYALASLHFFKGDYEKANEYAGKATSSFSSLSDEYRLNMSLVLKGDIEFKQGRIDKARDTYRLVLQSSDRNTEKLQYVRAALGLAELAISEHAWNAASKALGLLKGIDLKEYKAEKDRMTAISGKLPK